MEININSLDAALQRAYHHWRAPLQQGRDWWQQQCMAQAEAALSEAVRISASYHPLFHFFESGLNTELALTLYGLGEKEQLAPVVKRALFQDHFNPVMLGFRAWLEGGGDAPAFPRYDIWGLSSPLFDEGESAMKSTFLAAQALEGAAKAEALRAVIRACEANHGAFHRLSAEPYAVRAAFFLARGEEFLARNDVVKGLNLAPKWDKLLEMQASFESPAKKGTM